MSYKQIALAGLIVSVVSILLYLYFEIKQNESYE